MIQIKLGIIGMRCSACEAHIRNQLLKIDGIVSADVRFTLGNVIIKCQDNISYNALVSAIEKAGYQVKKDDIPLYKSKDSFNSSTAEERQAFLRFFVSFLLSLPFMVSMFFHLVFKTDNWNIPPLIQAVLCSAVIFFSGYHFYYNAFIALRNKAPNMELLVSIGVSVAFLASVARMIYQPFDSHLYFESAVMILTFVNCGEYLKLRAKNYTRAHVISLIELQPTQAEHITINGTKTVSPETLKPGDRVRIKPGSMIPCDGVIFSGQSHIDESLITGESIPVLRAEGDNVLTGTLNGDGTLEVDVSKTGVDTRLSHISRLVEETQLKKLNIQHLVNRVTEIFVPVILCISCVTFFFWSFILGDWKIGLECAISVLVISCPCALGLATPAALIAGVGSAAKAGILFRDMKIAEHALNIRVMAFDKTGTLTYGKPVVQSVISEAKDKQEILSYAAGIEQYSEHPLGKALVQHVENLGLEIPSAKDVKVLGGLGATGMVHSKHVVIGNAKLMKEYRISESSINKFMPESKAGESIAFILIDGLLAGSVSFSDTIRPEASKVIDQLSKNGIRSVMLTGDYNAAADSVARTIGISDIRSNLKPEDKVTAIEQLSREGKVAFTGDGLNDAPALAAADLGIAFSSGIYAAHEASPIVLMRPDLRLIPAVFEILFLTRRTIKQNLSWAFIYNIIAIPLAAFGILSPTLSSSAMVLSSLSVAGNSFFLTYWKPRSYS